MTSLVPMEKIWERVEIARQDSDTTLFLHLLYAGEALTKLTVAGLVAAIGDDQERHNYRLLHRLVRADGLGHWADVIDDVLSGPASQHIYPDARSDLQELSQRFGNGAWQYDATVLLQTALRKVVSDTEELPVKLSGKEWFRNFVKLRNKTRAHGATTPAICHEICPCLEESIRGVYENLSLLQRPWIYLHRNLSGKYRVVALGGDTSYFDHLKSAANTTTGQLGQIGDGVYIHFGSIAPVKLLTTDVDAADFFFPNGSFNGQSYELISYGTDSRMEGDSHPYLLPSGELPRSETDGLRSFDTIGENTFANLPPKPPGYVARDILENDLYKVLTDERHPIISLVGRGGIGKTSIALTVLYNIGQEMHFGVIVWFSARDIDLFTHGPKVVSPRVLTEKDIATEFSSLLNPHEASKKGFDSHKYFSEALTRSPIDQPILFVFDNFETLINPIDIYNWLNGQIRLPNKILITTRHREFKADYPIEVSGMTPDESDQLIKSVAQKFGVASLITDAYCEKVFQEADGHPYIIKVLIGEVAKSESLVDVVRIVSSKEDMLDALFERTFSALSPVATRIFLILCSWRSLIPQLVLEAVLHRPSNERMDVEAGIDELIKSSFIETNNGDDTKIFLGIPLVASVFGKRKLEVAPMKSAIQGDLELLKEIGSTQLSGLKHGIKPLIQRLFRYIAQKINQDKYKLEEYRPMLEFICKGYDPGWLLLATLYNESGTPNGANLAIGALRSLLERSDNETLLKNAWYQLEHLCYQTGDPMGEIHAVVGRSNLPGAPFTTLSNAANRLNSLFRQNAAFLDSEEKRIIVKELMGLIEMRIVEADATDLSRFAWLCLHRGEQGRARNYAQQGLSLDPENEHCQKLRDRLDN